MWSVDYFTSPLFEDTYNDFEPGWGWLGRNKDVSDFEWKYVLRLLESIIFWCILHVIGTELLWRQKFSQVISGPVLRQYY